MKDTKNNNSIEQFKELVIEKLNKVPEFNSKVETQIIIKNNGLKLEGIFIKQSGKLVSPTFYIEDLYDEYCNGADIDCIVNKVIDGFETRNVPADEICKFMSDFMLVKEKVVFKIINFDDNQDLLKEVPYRKVLDLAVVYYCRIDYPEIGRGTITIKNENIEMWNVSEEDLYEAAFENANKYLPCSIMPMHTVLGQYVEDNFTEELKEQEKQFVEKINSDVNLYVMTNNEKSFGAATMFYENVLENFAMQLHKNLYILPSSIHEVLLLPVEDKDNHKTMQLQEMVFEVNNTQVMLEERLSYNVYFYNLENKKIELL